MGFVTKTKEGIPQINNFPYTTSSAVKKYFEENAKSSYIQLMMLKPMKIGVPAFVYQVFGFDNVFNHKEARNRHNLGFDLLKSIDVDVLSFASDGDSRYLKLGLVKSKIGKGNTVPGFLNIIFDADLHCKTPYFQDMDHVSNKGII